MTATLKRKQTSIATVRYHLLPVASLLTPLIFHYPLPLKYCPVRWIRPKSGIYLTERRGGCLKNPPAPILSSCESPLKIPRHLVQLLAIRTLIANSSHSSVSTQPVIHYIQLLAKKVESASNGTMNI
jgi:hypothetical protein